MSLKTKYIEGKEYFEVCRSSELAEGQSIRVEIDFDRDLALFRKNGRIYCLSNVCPHKHEAKIYKGFLENNKVVCPMHGWAFLLETGENTHGKKGLTVTGVLETDGAVFVENKDSEKPKWMNF